MTEDENRIWYSAFKSKDTRFDGRFFIGISSTGIYCRPICRAKLPKAKNCTFYPSAAAAEQAGYRPCLLCRPELTPGTAPVDASHSLALHAARVLEEHCAQQQKMDEFAGVLGCTARHLRRTFSAQYGVSPVQYLQTCRLLLAKSLLTSTKLSISEIAMAAGFGSLRRFNALFKQHYRLPPTALRKQIGKEKTESGHVTLELGYRPPYLWQPMLDFLALRAIPGVETVRDGKYWRAVSLTTANSKQAHGWFCVENRPQRNVLSVTISITLLPVLPRILARIRHMFDLSCNPDAVYEGLESMNRIRPGLCVRGLHVPGCFEAFEQAVRAVLGQQITVKGARTLAARITATYGTPVPCEIEGLTHVFPSPETILSLPGSIRDHLGALGVTGARATTILELARMFASEQFNQFIPPAKMVERLKTIPGIGEWTAQYIAMRVLAWTDAFLPTDYGVKKALEPRTEKEISAIAETWRPWRSYATINLWNSL